MMTSTASTLTAHAAPVTHGEAFSKQWEALQKKHAQLHGVTLQTLFSEDAQRFDKFSFSHGEVLVDYSKQHIDVDALNQLLTLAEHAQLPAKIKQLFSGAAVNFTENRAVQHMVLRQRTAVPVIIDGRDVVPEVIAVRQRMIQCAQKIRLQRWLGATGKPITTVINIGIGGSDLGPRMVCTALAAFQHRNNSNDEIAPQVRFVANVDPDDITAALHNVDAQTCLFIVTSKTFTTQETLANATTARAWLQQHLGKNVDVSSHFIAVSAYPERAVQFGIAAENVFPMWDWVGGRYSLWSAVGLPIAIAIGGENFSQLLAGAADMDAHFSQAPLAKNLPVLHALVGIWNTNFERHACQLVIPYSEALTRLPAYLQQLEMESNGKQTDIEGNAIAYATCPALWGEPGTNGQHAFFQWLHQGTQIAPVDFIVAKQSNAQQHPQHQALLANALAQSRALLMGRSAPGGDLHRASPGNRPSSTIVLPKITPFSLGQLVALYEHKVFVQGVIWGINSFDQFGVELGKEIANQLLPAVSTGNIPAGLDSSTLGLLRCFNTH